MTLKSFGHILCCKLTSAHTKNSLAKEKAIKTVLTHEALVKKLVVVFRVVWHWNSQRSAVRVRAFAHHALRTDVALHWGVRTVGFTSRVPWWSFEMI